MESRLIGLETRYAHLERQVDELSQVVFEQQKFIDRLTKEVAVLSRRMAGVEDGPGERPPHY
jgi:SlyX protein